MSEVLNDGRTVWRVQLVLQLLMVGALLLPELAHAQSDPTGGGLSQVGGWLKSIVNLVIFQWGYYIGCLALALTGVALWRGQLALGAAAWCTVGILVFFFAPSLVTSLKNLAQQSAQMQ